MHGSTYLPSRRLIGDDALPLLNIPKFIVLRSCPRGQKYRMQLKPLLTTYGESLPSDISCVERIIHRMLPAGPCPVSFVLVCSRMSISRRARSLVLILVISSLAPRSSLIPIARNLPKYSLSGLCTRISRSFVDRWQTNDRAIISWLQGSGGPSIALEFFDIQTLCASFFVSNLASLSVPGQSRNVPRFGCDGGPSGTFASHCWINS